jgi:hypothetical protein
MDKGDTYRLPTIRRLTDRDPPYLRLRRLRTVSRQSQFEMVPSIENVGIPKYDDYFNLRCTK